MECALWAEAVAGGAERPGARHRRRLDLRPAARPCRRRPGDRHLIVERERAKALGADDVINYRTHPEWATEVKRLTGGRGVDHVIEIGGTGTLGQSIASVNIGGIVSLVGLLAVADAPAVNPMPILTSGAIVRGVLVGSRELFENMNRAIALHRIKPVIDTVYPFDQAAKALQALAAQRHVGKIVIKIGD
jgi:NADPH:quinone reductase-like Zn-dependent oxidoreductase